MKSFFSRQSWQCVLGLALILSAGPSIAHASDGDCGVDALAPYCSDEQMIANFEAKTGYQVILSKDNEFSSDIARALNQLADVESIRGKFFKVLKFQEFVSVPPQDSYSVAGPRYFLWDLQMRVAQFGSWEYRTPDCHAQSCSSGYFTPDADSIREMLESMPSQQDVRAFDEDIQAFQACSGYGKVDTLGSFKDGMGVWTISLENFSRIAHDLRQLCEQENVRAGGGTFELDITDQFAIVRHVRAVPYWVSRADLKALMQRGP